MTERRLLPRPRPRRFGGILGRGSLLGCVMLASVLPTPASARQAPSHASARNFTPAANSVVASAPVAGLLLGDAGIGNGPRDFINVFDSQGIEHSGATSGRASGDLSIMSTTLSAMKKGWYAVHWNAESGDGHMAGGDDGSWWVFGVGTKTVIAATKKLKFNVDVKTSALPISLSASVNGLRSGLRRLTFAKTSVAVAKVRLTLVKSGVRNLVGAEFDWAVGYDKKAKSSYAMGALPFVGTYQVTVQGVVGSVTGVWRSEVTVSA